MRVDVQDPRNHSTINQRQSGLLLRYVLITAAYYVYKRQV
jgi:hypothetical protein